MTIVAMTGISGYLGTLISDYSNQNSKFEKIIRLDIIEPAEPTK